MKKWAFLLTFFSFPFLITSCFQDRSGPYSVGLLTKLKSKNESDYLINYYKSHDIYSYSPHYSWWIHMKYNSEQKNIIVSDWTEYNKNIEYDVNIKNLAEEFLNNYYFITNEKLYTLFPLKYTHAGYQKFSKTIIEIKKYDSDEDYEQNNYHTFKYSYDNGFLFLKSHTYTLNYKFKTVCEFSFS